MRSVLTLLLLACIAWFDIEAGLLLQHARDIAETRTERDQ